MLTKHFDIVFILALLINDVAEFILYSSRNDSLFNSSLSPAPNHRWVSTVAPFPPFLDALQNCLLSEFLYCSILLNNTVFDLLSKIGSYAKNFQKLSFIYSKLWYFPMHISSQTDKSSAYKSTLSTNASALYDV